MARRYAPVHTAIIPDTPEGRARTTFILGGFDVREAKNLLIIHENAEGDQDTFRANDPSKVTGTAIGNNAFTIIFREPPVNGKLVFKLADDEPAQESEFNDLNQLSLTSLQQALDEQNVQVQRLRRWLIGLSSTERCPTCQLPTTSQ